MILYFLNLWPVNLILHLFFAVTYNQFYKISIKDNYRDGSSTVLLQIICALSLLFLVPFFPWKYSQDPKVYALLFLAFIFYAINDRVQTTARSGLPTSEFAIILQLSKVFLVVVGWLVFHDLFVWNRIIGATLIFIGVFALLFNRGQFSLNKSAVLALLGTLAMSIGMSIDIGLISQFNMPFYLALSVLIPSIFIASLERIPWHHVKRELIKGQKRYYLATGISWAGAMFFLYRAFVTGQVSVVSPLSTLNILFNVVIAYFYLGERDHLWKKIFISLLIILGVCAISC